MQSADTSKKETMDLKLKHRKSYACCVCDKTFNGPCHLERHFRVHTGERPFKCEICQFSFKSQAEITAHSIVHSIERPFACVFCKKTYKRVKELNLHISSHTRENPYFCSKCPASFSTNGGLTQHVVPKHGSKKGKKCQYCPKMLRKVILKLTCEYTQAKKHSAVQFVKRSFPEKTTFKNTL